MKTVCPTCGRVIEPAEIRSGNFEEMVCPSCSSQFRGRHSEIGSMSDMAIFRQLRRRLRKGNLGLKDLGALNMVEVATRVGKG
jgi:DNA-directed RNA polymerase subunit M/transcription elongation factor TFIIS